MYWLDFGWTGYLEMSVLYALDAGKIWQLPIFGTPVVLTGAGAGVGFGLGFGVGAGFTTGLGFEGVVVGVVVTVAVVEVETDTTVELVFIFEAIVDVVASPSAS